MHTKSFIVYLTDGHKKFSNPKTCCKQIIKLFEWWMMEIHRLIVPDILTDIYDLILILKGHGQISFFLILNNYNALVKPFYWSNKIWVSVVEI